MAHFDNMSEEARRLLIREMKIEHTIECVIYDYMEGDSDDGKNLNI